MTPLEIGERILGHLPYEPNEQQTQLIAALARYVCPTEEASSSADRVFLLNGYAGTGKTSVIGALVKTLGELRIPTVLLAPTGRAAKVLSAACSHPAYTIHRRIYRPSVGTVGGYVPTVQENRLANAVFIVDEASMIGNEGAEGAMSSLLHDLLVYVFSGINCKLILLGDTAQLPPVGTIESPAMDAELLRSMGLKVTRVVITATARQKARSGILYNATAQRIAMGNDPLPQPVIYASPFPDVRIIDEREELSDAISADYRGAADGMDETIIITRSNKRAMEFNQSVRRDILEYEEELRPGERLLVVKNNYYWSQKTPGLDFIANGDVAVIERVIGVEYKYGMRFADVVLSMPDRDATFEAKLLLNTLYSPAASLDPADAQKFERAMMTDPELFEPTHTLQHRQRALRSNPYYQALRVKYAYCVTCHKAQGGQWRNVYVDTDYIPPEALGLELYRWLYTATTRATGKVTFIAPPFDRK